MSLHISSQVSESEQMYLIAIARSIEDGETGPLPISHLAQKLSLQPVSVNQMVRKLESEGLVQYHPYKGVELTELGKDIASKTLRNRRLWEVFLVDELHVSLEEADVMACDLEHVTPDDIAQRLFDYLGKPVIGPGGQQIPKIDGEQVEPNWFSLNQLEVGRKGQILRVEAKPAVTRFLAGEGLRPGAEIQLVGIGAHDSRLLRTGQGYLEITAEIAQAIKLLPAL